MVIEDRLPHALYPPLMIGSMRDHLGFLAQGCIVTRKALNKLSDAPVSSLLAICYHNLAASCHGRCARMLNITY